MLLIDSVFATRKRPTDIPSLWFILLLDDVLFGGSELNDLGDPVSELGYSCVDPGLVFLCTANAPGYDTGEHETVVGPTYGHGPTAVTLNSAESYIIIGPLL